MATVIYNRFAEEPGSGFVSAADASHLTVTFGSGFTDTYFGSFTYSGGAITGGVLTDFAEAQGGEPLVTASGLNTPAAPVFVALLSGDIETALNLMFAGNDSVQGSAGDDPILGFGGDDIVIALDGNDTIAGEGGNDDLNGNKGVDVVLGGDGADTVRGGQGDDSVYGDAGDDPHVNGNIGEDIVFGGSGNDTVYGGQGTDTLHGDAGNDLLSGDLGAADLLYGDAGADRFTVRAGSGFDWVVDWNPAEGDRIQLAPGTAFTVTSFQGQVVIDLGNGDELGLVGVPAGSFNTSWVVFG